MMSTCNLPCRYYRHQTDPDKPNDEAHLEFHYRSLPLELEATALVLVDCWDKHHNEGWARRATDCMAQYVVPVLHAARQCGITVIHCPSQSIACHYPQWKKYGDQMEDVDLPPADQPRDKWPPKPFILRQGDYEVFGPMKEQRDFKTHCRIHDLCQPRDNEFVVGTGVQLHHLCSDRKLLHLVYAGFATNRCILSRTYGMRNMYTYGYNLILIRDATVAIESHDTLSDESHHRHAVREVEIQLGWTCTTSDFCAAVHNLDNIA